MHAALAAFVDGGIRAACRCSRRPTDRRIGRACFGDPARGRACGPSGGRVSSGSPAGSSTRSGRVAGDIVATCGGESRAGSCSQAPRRSVHADRQGRPRSIGWPAALWRIIDYKTGVPPTEQRDRERPRAAVAAGSGDRRGRRLRGLEPAYAIGAATTGGCRAAMPADMRRQRAKALDGQLADAAARRTAALIDRFDDPATPYASRAAAAPGAALQRLRPPRAGQGVGGRRRERRMMDAPRSLVDDPHEPQRGACDPRASVWVAASAGTGKTKVLTDRVLRLMLAGTEPGRILCLTFTKAAAAEMANRIAERLGAWATADAARLEAAALSSCPAGSRRTSSAALARQLFARVLDAPGGTKIQTIHAFCQSLLGRFPLEAGVAPHSR